jgi:hypothetical protein
MLLIGTPYTAGHSGNSYDLKEFPIPYEYTIPNEWIGIYIFSKSSGEFILIGEGNIKDQTDLIIGEGVVQDYGATSILIHVEPDNEKRKEKMVDIILGNPECYGENGLNEQPIR